MPDDVAGQQIRGKLDAPVVDAGAGRQTPRQGGLADPRHILDQHVQTGDEPDQHMPYLTLLSDEHLTDVAFDGCESVHRTARCPFVPWVQCNMAHRRAVGQDTQEADAGEVLAVRVTPRAGADRLLGFRTQAAGANRAWDGRGAVGAGRRASRGRPRQPRADGPGRTCRRRAPAGGGAADRRPRPQQAACACRRVPRSCCGAGSKRNNGKPAHAP